jgi:hypothetical protein
MNPGMVEIGFGNNATHKKPAVPGGQRRAFYLLPANPEQSRDVIVSRTSNTLGLVQELFPVAQRRFGVLVD